MSITVAGEVRSLPQPARQGKHHVGVRRQRWVVVILALAVASCTEQPENPSTDLTDPDTSWPPANDSVASSDPPSPGQESDVPPDSASKNRALWAMPLDEFRPILDRIDSYGENLLAKDCIEAAGYEWPVPWQDVDAMGQNHERMNAVGSRLFNVEIAHKLGYHVGIGQSTNDIAWREFGRFASKYNGDEKFGAVASTCIAKARERVPLPSSEAMIYAASLASQAHAEALLDPAVIEAAGRWKACMQPVGVADLPDTPEGLPTAEQAERFEIGDPSASPSPEEVEIAVADAECMESSGYSPTLYDAEWELQSRAVEQNRDTLDRIRSELQDRRESMLKVIAQHAPEP